jgi:hypothetical protein
VTGVDIIDIIKAFRLSAARRICVSGARDYRSSRVRKMPEPRQIVVFIRLWQVKLFLNDAVETLGLQGFEATEPKIVAPLCRNGTTAAG